MRKLFFAIVLLLCVVFIISQIAEVEAIADTLKRGDWRFLLLALGVEIAWLVNVAASYRSIFQATGVEEKIETLFVLSTAANFVNVVAPSVGMGGMAVFIAEARRRGYSPARATIAGALYVLFDYTGFLCILTIGWIVLLRRNNFDVAEITASVILIILALGLATMLFLGMRSAHSLGSALVWMARQVNRLIKPFTRRKYLSEERAIAFASEAAEGLNELRQNPQNLLMPFGLALSNKTLLISILFFVFMAFKAPISVGTLVAGFSVAYLFLIVSPTPSGLGVVEGALTLALSTMYIPLSVAAVITLAYRAITFWFPLVFGVAAFRHLAHT